MVIQHNMCSLNARRQWKQRTGKLAKSAEKLSSGYKVNRSADDAAGLCISEKMRCQIRGLRRASENIEDGVSLCQVADGALNETVDILQRMRELAIQSANGTNSESDRQNIEAEVAQLQYEIDRIARVTEFNDTIHPLNAPVTFIEETEAGNSGSPDIPNVSGPDAPNPDVTNPDVPNIPDTLPVPAPNEGLLREKTITFTTNRACNYDGKNYKIGDSITVTGLTTNGSEIWVSGGSVYDPGVWGTGNSAMSAKMGPLKKSDLNFDSLGRIYYWDVSNEKRYAFYVTDPSHLSSFNGTSGNPDPMHFSTQLSAATSLKEGWARYMVVADLYDKDPNFPKPPDPDPPKPPDSETVKPSDPKAPTTAGGYYLCSGDSIAIHAGDSSRMSNKIPIYMVNATCKGLGITDVTVSTQDSATKAIDLIDKGISRAAEYRSMFGAVQNHLEHAEMINDNTAENTQSAESKIRDTDIALEIVQYSSMRILAQACQSMLAQANQSNQGVLNLLS